MTSEQREKVRSYIRGLLERGQLTKGIQSQLAREYGVTRQAINQIARDERKRLINPVTWEIDKARRQRKEFSVLELMESLKDHQAYKTRD